MSRVEYPKPGQWPHHEDQAYGSCNICGIMGARTEYTVGGRYPHFVNALLCPDCADLPIEQALRLGRRVGTVAV